MKIQKTVLPTLALSFGALSAHAAPATQVTTLLMQSAKVDLKTDTVTLPLHVGQMKDGRKVWFILTDTSDRAGARSKGLVHASELANAASAMGTRTATVDANGVFTFAAGTVDFSPAHALTPGDAPNLFPPKAVQPGSVGDADYSPFVKVTNQNNAVYNAPILAFNVDATALNFCNGQVPHNIVHDKVTAICPATMQVTLQLTHGFADGQEVVYISTDSNDPTPATMESATYAPALNGVKTLDVSLPLFAFVNGETGVNNPERQGFDSALAGEGSPLNILADLTAQSTGYSPLWDVNVAVWTPQSIAANERHQLTSGEQVMAAMQSSLLTNPMGGMVQSLGLLVNCPVIAFVQ